MHAIIIRRNKVKINYLLTFCYKYYKIYLALKFENIRFEANKIGREYGDGKRF